VYLLFCDDIFYPNSVFSIPVFTATHNHPIITYNETIYYHKQIKLIYYVVIGSNVLHVYHIHSSHKYKKPNGP